MLEALDGRGKLTAAGTVLESSLTVEKAERMLYELAVRGHLEFSLAHGRLHYALWECDAAPCGMLVINKGPNRHRLKR